MTTLLLLVGVSLIGLALLKDISTNGLIAIWLALLIKWVWLSMVIVLALKPLADIRDGLTNSLSFEKKADGKPARHSELVEKPILLRRKDLIVKKYRVK
jgi:uncharacterized protein (DUF983 family)